MELEDIDEDFEYGGECYKCDALLDNSEAATCNECGQTFCWNKCGGWSGAYHTCNECGGE